MLYNGAWFGPNNKYKCNCETSCNTDGTCTNNGKCNSGWFGLKCQYQDLVVQSLTTISTSADKLTDRNDTTCLETDRDVVIDFNRNFVFTWLRIVINNETLLSTLTVQFKKGKDQPITDCDQKRFYLVGNLTLDIRCYLKEEIQQVIVSGTGVKSLCSLYINGGRNVALKQDTYQTSNYSDSTRSYDSSLAVDGDQDRLRGFTLEANGSTNDLFTYQDTSTSNIGLPVYTVLDAKKRTIQDVTIKSRSGQMLALCEVEIYGECPTGTYDLNCTNCKAFCLDTCHIDDGSCNMVCFGYSNPPNCNVDCNNGSWGINCNKTCSRNCKDPNQCDKFSGHCLGGCAAGFQLPDCVKNCFDNSWGVNCSQTCSNNCKSKSCNTVTGQCRDGCLSGYTPPNCNTSCADGHWGDDCLKNCSRYCYDNKTCDKFNGQCPSGCIAGYEPPLCNKDCNNGSWGINCNKTCSRNCKDPNQCDKMYGHCLGGCAAGFQLPDCVKSCADGRWGKNCTNNCSRYCHDDKTCDKLNGQCPSGCIAGYVPPYCDNECGVGYWGVNCSLECNFQCLNHSCHHKDGYCLRRCIDGYQSHYCTQGCKDFQWGENCEYNCSDYFLNKTCDIVNGFCLDQGSTNKEENSLCTDFGVGFGAGLATGLGVLIISLVILYIWHKRRILNLHKQYQQQQCYSQLEISQVEKHVYAKIVLLLYIVNVDLTDTADIENDVFFGPNGVYKCHCASGCNTNGTCSNNGPCSKGWFGLKCQYQDLATIDGTNVQPPAAEKLTDRNDTTCLQNNQQTVNVTFNTTYVFTWMRIVVNNESMLSNFTFQFTTRSSGSDVLDCERKRFFLINSKTLDIKCYFTRIIEKVSIGGPGVASLCSLYINGEPLLLEGHHGVTRIASKVSGRHSLLDQTMDCFYFSESRLKSQASSQVGRNVALKQVTWQSSNFSIENFVYDASKAVDGDTSGNFSKNSCSHTDVPDSTPTWSVRFKSSEITRYIIYNRASYQERLHGFTLEAKGEGGGKFTYKDNSTSMVYTVLDSLKHNITNVTIDVKEYTFPILTLCEVEIYGECQSGTWDLECKNCSASCSGTCHIDDGSCNMVCFGFKDPPDCLQ
ncbi:hypothetical protein Btru_017789, partial [Bulinus truncatus]